MEADEHWKGQIWLLGCQWGWTLDEAVAEDEEDDEDVEPFLPSVEDSSNDMALQQLLCKKEWNKNDFQNSSSPKYFAQAWLNKAEKV